MNWEDNIIYGLVIGIICGVLVGIWYKMAHLGSKSEHYKEVCIQGHTYYRASYMGQMGLTIKLDDNGKPVKCIVNK